MLEYRGIYIPECPNHCFERIIDSGIARHIVEGVEPRIRPENMESTGYSFRRYSKKLKRHSHTTNGCYYSEPWSHCPHCGSRLK